MNKQKSRPQTKKIANLFRALGQPARIRILLTIGEGEACVCHLEAVLGYRQAYISQQLMELRKARIVSARRDGRFIFYHLRDVGLLQWIQEAGKYAGVSNTNLDIIQQGSTHPQCCCPKCVPESLTPVTLEENILT